MDASLESFIEYRVDRLKDISIELFGQNRINLIPKICRLLSNFCLKRPNSPFFDQAEGSRLIRKDLKYFFPAIYGIDIRPFTSGSRLELKRKKFLREKESFTPCAALLSSLARLMLMVITYDLLMVDVDFISETDEKLLKKAQEQSSAFYKLFSEYLVNILSLPPHAQVLHLTRGEIKRKTKTSLTRENHQTILGWIEFGVVPLDPSKLDAVFEKVCQEKSTQIPVPRLALDLAEKVVVDTKKLLQYPITDKVLLKTMRFRYHISSYLFTASYYRHAREKREVLTEKVASSLENLKVISKEETTNLADFLIGDQSRRLHQRAGFYFDPLPRESEIDWQSWERKAVFLGKKPDNPKLSPQHIKLPAPLAKSDKKPVCIMLDVSSSMSDCLDIAIQSLGMLFAKLRHHPINLVLFSTCAGVLNKGVPLVSRGLPLSEELPWLPGLVDSIRQGLFLGGTTSIGNGILLGKAIALGTASKLKRYQRWMAENNIAAHCILISDNLHNSPRDITETDAKGKYLLEGKENVIAHTARAGCSIHNLICCPPTSHIDKIIFRMQVMKYVEIIAKEYFSPVGNGLTLAKTLENNLIMTVLSSQPRTFLFQYGNQDKFTLVNTWLESDELNQLMQAIAGFVVYVRSKLPQKIEIYDALEFIGREFRVAPQEFMEPVIDLDKIFKIYELMIQESEVILENLDYGIFDASPMQIFKISHFIAETQRTILPFSTTPVIIKLEEALDRRKDFENELYFGLKNLEVLDSCANYITGQIEAMV